MLSDLVRYALERGLQTEPGFELGKEVHWALQFDPEGAFLGVQRLGNPDAKGKIKGGIRVAKAPVTPAMNSGGKSHAIVETADVVTDLGVEALSAEDRTKVERKRAHYLIHLAALDGILPGAGPIGRTLGDASARAEVAAALAACDAKPTDKVCPSVDGELLIDRREWQDWWREAFAMLKDTATSAAGPSMICLATGEPVAPARTHTAIRGVPDANPTGALLVSFDKDPFQSYGLDKSNNAAVGAEAVAAYAAALQDLLRTQKTRIGEATVVHWYRGTPQLDDDPLAFLRDPDPEGAAMGRVRALVSAIDEGQRPNLLIATYQVLTLSGMSARIMVRDWQTGNLADLLRAVLAWFEDLRLESPYGGDTNPPPFWMILQAAGIKVGQDKFEEAPPAVAARLWGAAIGGRSVPIPHSVLAATVLHERAFILSNGPKITPFRDARIGLMRAFHNRRSPHGVPMSAGLDPNHPDPAYHCGRLLAVLAALQDAALGDVGAGVVARFYASASSTPALVFGRILRTSQHHLAKLEGGLAHWYEGHIASVTNAIGSIPRTLDLERQSLFALGYYHQIAADRRARAERKAEKASRTATESTLKTGA